MIFTNKYILKSSPSFNYELEYIYRHMAFHLKEPFTASKFYDRVIQKISSLEYCPEKYVKFSNFKNKNKNRNLRKVSIDNYIIMYEISTNTKQVFILHIFHCTQNYLNLL